MGQNPIIDLSMIIHVCGVELDNSNENINRKNLINYIFTEDNSEESKYDYKVKTSKNPKWNAFIYRKQKNFSIIRKTIKANIELAKKNKDDKKYKYDSLFC